MRGHHVRHHVERVFKREQLPTRVRISCAMKVSRVQLQPDITDNGRHGQHVRPLVVAAFNNVVVTTVVVKHHMFRNVHVPCHRVNGDNGPNGPIVPFHVAAPMWLERDSTRVLAKSTVTANTVTLIHVRIMVPGPIGRHVRHRVVWAE